MDKTIKDMNKKDLQMYEKIIAGENRFGKVWGRAVASEFREWQGRLCIEWVELRFAHEN